LNPNASRSVRNAKEYGQTVDGVVEGGTGIGIFKKG
jgi:hypothetical protein